MTRAQYEAAKRQAAARYVQTAGQDLSQALTQRQKENAARRIERAVYLLALWDQQGFWTADNCRAYELIYRHYGENDAVSGV